MDSQIFVQNIKKYCDLKGIKPTPACRDAGVSSSFISNIERGAMPSIDKVQMLATYLGVTVSDLIGEEIKLGEGDEADPNYRELRYIIENASAGDRRRFLDLIRMYKGFEDDAAERRKLRKKSSSAQGEAVEGEKEPVFEAGKPVDHGTYRCVGCEKDFITIDNDGTALRPCAVCGEIYWSKIK